MAFMFESYTYGNVWVEVHIYVYIWEYMHIFM